jgi:Rrf2 family protein
MALAYIARSESGTTSAKKIVDELEVPRRLLAEVLKDLSRSTIVSGTRGPGGGYRLNKKPSEISLCEVVECLDGPLNVMECSDHGVCSHSPSCIIKSGVTKLAEDLRSVLTNATVADLAEGSPEHHPHPAAALPIFPV